MPISAISRKRRSATACISSAHRRQAALETDLLVALTRVPRGLGEGGDQSLIRALADDFGFDGFDPLTCDMARPLDRPEARSPC